VSAYTKPMAHTRRLQVCATLEQRRHLNPLSGRAKLLSTKYVKQCCRNEQAHVSMAYIPHIQTSIPNKQ
jgi:hypothetical protein